MILKAIGTAMLGLVLALCLVQPVAAQTPAPGTPRLHGSFMQLLTKHGSWQPSDWKQLFGHFQAMQLSELVIQWSAFDDLRFYPSAGAQAGSSPGSPLEEMMKLADAARMRVLVGLVHDSEFWSQIRQDPPQLANYLRDKQARSRAVASEVAAMVSKNASFEGWYLTVEIDDGSWLDPARRELLFKYLHDLSGDLRRATPSARIAVSGFSNARLDPQGLEAFWAELLERAPAIDTVLFQDGVGVHKLSVTEVPLYMAAVRNAAARHGKQLRTVVETFRQTAGPPLDDKPFAAAPATIEQLRQQVEVATRFASSVVAFSVPEYMSPAGGPAATLLFERYLKDVLHP
jgi:hypothetical protein